MKGFKHKNVVRCLSDASQLIYMKHGVTIKYCQDTKRNYENNSHYILKGTTRQFQEAIEEMHQINLKELRLDFIRDELYDMMYNESLQKDPVKVHNKAREMIDVLNGRCDKIVLRSQKNNEDI